MQWGYCFRFASRELGYQRLPLPAAVLQATLKLFRLGYKNLFMFQESPYHGSAIIRGFPVFCGVWHQVEDTLSRIQLSTISPHYLYFWQKLQLKWMEFVLMPYMKTMSTGWESFKHIKFLLLFPWKLVQVEFTSKTHLIFSNLSTTV